jgi:hypothetical protein
VSTGRTFLVKDVLWKDVLWSRDFEEGDVLYRGTFCIQGRFVEGRFVEGRLVEGRLVGGRFVGRTFCSEGRFVVKDVL